MLTTRPPHRLELHQLVLCFRSERHRETRRTASCSFHGSGKGDETILSDWLHKVRSSATVWGARRTLSDHHGMNVCYKNRDINRKPEIWKPVLFLWQPVFDFFSFSSRKLHKNYQICQWKLIHTFVYCWVFINVFIKQSDMAAKETIYYNL